MSVLRYHRADAHAAAWQAAGLTSQAMMQLPADPVRAAIEAETNRRAGAPYATLSADERVALLAGLAARLSERAPVTAALPSKHAATSQGVTGHQ